MVSRQRVRKSTVRLPAKRSSASVARRFVADLCADTFSDEELDDIVLCTSEILGQIAEAGCTGTDANVYLTVTVDEEAATVEISERSHGRLSNRRRDDLRTAIVDSLMDEVRIMRVPGRGACVRMTLRASHSGS